MRPGLDKPGALPLLVLIVFSLLTLAPSLSSIYKFADLTYYYPGARTSIRPVLFVGQCRANVLTLQKSRSSRIPSPNFPQKHLPSTIASHGSRQRNTGPA